MGASYYGFACFIFVLFCLFALLCKYLFGRARKQLLALDEKEKKLLSLYSTLENMMDEFNDSAAAATADIGRHSAEMRQAVAILRGEKPVHSSAAPQNLTLPHRENPPAPPAATTDQLTAAPAAPAFTPIPAPPPAAAPLFVPAPESAAVPAAAPTPAPMPPEAAKPGLDRHTRIIALHQQGMDRLHIAKELSVTLSEVDLVLGIAKRG